MAEHHSLLVIKQLIRVHIYLPLGVQNVIQHKLHVSPDDPRSVEEVLQILEEQGRQKDKRGVTKP